MRRKPSYLKAVLCSVILLLVTGSAYANHIVGMDMFYTWVSGNTYKVTLVIYGDCGAAASSPSFAGLPTVTPQICLYDGNSYVNKFNLAIQAPADGVEITPVCPADVALTQCTNTDFDIPGIKKFLYTGTVTLPYASSVWRFLFVGNLPGVPTSFVAGRATSITNVSDPASSSVISLVDTLNNTIFHNSSPALTVVPTPFFCLNNNDNYNPGAVDADGDSLSFALVAGMNGSGAENCLATGEVTYAAPYTGPAPLAATSFTFDSHTGQISFYPNALQRSLVVYNVQEYRGGVFVGSCQREMTFLVLTCTNTAATASLTGAVNATINDATHLTACADSGPFSVQLNPTEPTTTNLITVTTAGMPAGATFTTTGNGTSTPHCTFSWSTTGVAPGSYNFYITYTDNNCPLAGTNTQAYTITISPAPTIAYTTLSDATCIRKAAISIIPGGGGAPWITKVSRGSSPFDTLQTFTGMFGSVTDSLWPGNYVLTIYSSVSHTCKASLSLTIAALPPVALTPTSVNPSYCGSSDGSITLYNLTAGTLDTIKYYYNGVLQPAITRTIVADGSVTLTGLRAGVYSNITVAYGMCVSQPSTVVLSNPAFTMRALTVVNPDYCGICNGSVTLYGLHPGQTDTINFSRSGLAQSPVAHLVGADSTITISGLCTGVYTGFVANTAAVCISNTISPAVLTAPFTMRAVTAINPDYCGICNGTIKLFGLHPGQTDTINYLKDGLAQLPVVRLVGADSIVTITGLCAGVYSNFVASTGGVCVSNTLGPVTLAVPPFTMRAVTGTNPDYCGICNGTIKIFGLHPGQTDSILYTKDGVAQAPYVHLVGADSSLTITGLCAGVYDNFVARTAGTCVSNMLGPVTLSIPPFTIRTLVSTNPDYCGVCNGTIKIFGLHPGQTDSILYNKDGVAQTPYVHLVGTDSTLTITGLCAGVYDHIIARTAGVCVSNTLGPANLVVPPFTMRTITFTNPDYCGICNGTIKLWGLHPGQTDTITYTKDGVAQPQQVFVIGADSAVILTGLCFGTYANFVAKTGGICVSNTLGPVTLTVPPFSMRAITFTNPDYCGICNGTIKLWGLHPGQTDTINYTKDGVAQPQQVFVIGADSTVTLTGLCFGTYANFVAKTGGVCVSNTLGPVTLAVPPFTMRAVTGTNPDYCGICNGTIKLWGLHPGQTDTINYTKDGVAQPQQVFVIGADSTVTLTGLCFGTYANFIAKTGGVCVSNTLGPVDLVVPPFTVRSATFTNPTKCGFCDGTITIHGAHPGQVDNVNFTFNGAAQPAVTYTVLADSVIMLTGLCEGVYDNIVVQTAAGVCVANTLGPLTLVAPPITAGYTFDIRKSCEGDTVVFTNTSAPASDLTYQWFFGDGATSTATNPVHIYYLPGVYTVRLLITNTRCFDSSIQSVTLDNLVKASFTMSPDSFVCTGKPVFFTNSSQGTSLVYNWSFGHEGTSTDVNPVDTFRHSGIDTIMLTVTNYVPCHDTAYAVLEVDSISAISMLLTDSVLCRGHDVSFTGIFSEQGSTSIKWTFADNVLTGSNPVMYSFDAAGVYTVTLDVTYRACPNIGTSRQVTVFDYPGIYLGSDTSICPGSDAITLTDEQNINNAAASWKWSTGETTPKINVVAPGYYYATVTIDGCSQTDTVWVSDDCYMGIPNAFTPNGDGVNDYFFPRDELARGLLTFRMEIYNRWGQMIFETDNTEGRGWDGRFNNVPQPEGVFIYRIDATFKDGQKEHHQGNVTLLR